MSRDHGDDEGDGAETAYERRFAELLRRFWRPSPPEAPNCEPTGGPGPPVDADA